MIYYDTIPAPLQHCVIGHMDNPIVYAKYAYEANLVEAFSMSQFVPLYN
jgi:hypothetical protein